jgi:hypothetical protein
MPARLLVPQNYVKPTGRPSPDVEMINAINLKKQLDGKLPGALKLTTRVAAVPEPQACIALPTRSPDLTSLNPHEIA